MYISSQPRPIVVFRTEILRNSPQAEKTMHTFTHTQSKALLHTKGFGALKLLSQMLREMQARYFHYCLE